MMATMNFLDDRLPPSFWDKAIPEPMSGCWLWIGCAQGAGYGMATVNGKYGLAHRHAYRAAHGEVPNGLELDHLCRTPLCCNPAHLEAVTHRENMLRGDTPAARNHNKTHCDSGHEFTADNTWVNRHGHRFCRSCRSRYESNRTTEQKKKIAAYKAAWKRRKRALRTAG